MKETFIVEETGEKITIDVKESSKVSPEQARKVEREHNRYKMKFFSNSEKKKYLIKRKLR